MLAVVLVAMIPLLGTGSSFVGDEGSAIIQARHLARGAGWIVDHPLPQVDDSGRAYPLELSEAGSRGRAPFAKHPLYPVVLAAADRVGGTAAMVLLSLGGTVAAGVLAAALGGRLGPALARPSLWVVGLATPLLFDGYLVIAHTLGAAGAAGSVALGLGLVEGRRRPVLAAAGVAGCVAVAVLLRAEAVLWGIGLAVALGCVAVRRRNRGALVAALAAGLATAVARIGERAWIAHIVGPAVTAPATSPRPAATVAGRLGGFELTWLAPAYGRSAAVALVLVVFQAVLVVAVAARHVPERRVPITVGAVMAATAAAAALAAGPATIVPGLLMTSPVIVAGIVCLGRSTLATVPARVAAGAFALFAAGVLATQYPGGGGVEWGGRYFALGLPVLVPVLLLALTEVGGNLDRAVRTAAVVALVVCSAALTAIGLTGLGTGHRVSARLVAAAERAGSQTSSTSPPLLVSTVSVVPRLAWATFDRQRWLITSPRDLAPLLARVRAAGITDVVLVTRDRMGEHTALGPGVDVVSTTGSAIGRGWVVAVVHLGP